MIVGQNPPYFVEDFFATYPKWAGPQLAIPNATTTNGSATVTLTALVAGVVPGLPLIGPGIPDGSFIQAVSSDGKTLTLTLPATEDGSAVSLTTWPTPIVPYPVILAYITLASASLAQARWLDMWNLAMGLFVAHYLTLYGLSDIPSSSAQTAQQAAQQGFAIGIKTSESAGDLSVSFTPLAGGLESWGAWNLTLYGQQLPRWRGSWDPERAYMVRMGIDVTKRKGPPVGYGDLGGMSVLVGIPAKTTMQGRKTTINNASLLFIHSNGSALRNLPARPVIEPAIAANQQFITPELANATKAALADDPQGVNQALNRAGLIAANACKQWFFDPRNNWAPLSPAAIRAKGSSQPLIDTGAMRRSITYVVLEVASGSAAVRWTTRSVGR